MTHTYSRIGLLVLGFVLLPLQVFAAEQMVFENDATKSFNARTIVIDQTDRGGNLTLQFGQTLAKTLTYDTTNSWFNFNGDVRIQGDLTATGSVSVKGDLSGSTLHVDGASTINGTTTINGNMKVRGTLSGSTLRVDNLHSCDSIDTDANGIASCGTDAGSTFLSLTDTPSSFSGQGSKAVRVNASGSALEFVALTSGGQLLCSNASNPAGNTIANTSSVTAFATTCTIPAGTLIAGDVIHIKLFGYYSNALTPPNIEAWIKWNSTTLIDTGTFTGPGGASNLGWSGEASTIVQTTGTTGTVDSQAYLEFATAATTALSINIPNTSTATINTTIDNTISISVQWSAASASNSVTLRNAAFSKLNTKQAPGNVVGPSISTDNAIPRFDTASGTLIQNSGVLIDDANNITGVGTLRASTLSGSTVYAKNALSSSGAITVRAASGSTTIGFFKAYKTDGYAQINVQNTAPGPSASTDIVATNNIGNESKDYIDLGINSSNYTNASYSIGGARDGYLYASDGNLTIGTASGKSLIFHTNGTTSAEERMRINSSGNVGIGTASPETTLEVIGTASGRIVHAQSQLRSSGSLVIEGASSFEGNLTFGDALSDALTVNAATWTFANDTNFVLSGGVNSLSFDTSTLSIDATNHRVGIGTIAPETALELNGTLSGASIQSFGLTNCSDATSSKLLWNSSTNTFSCGTDQDTAGSSGLNQTSGDARYVNTSGDTMTGTLIIRKSAGPQVRLSSGATVSSPVSGDLWNDAAKGSFMHYVSGIKQTLPGVIFTQTADTTVTNTTEATLIGSGTGTTTLPANFFRPGKTIRLHARGIYSTVAVTMGTLNVKLKLGSTTLVSTTAISQASGVSNQYWEVFADITCRTVGTSGTVQAIGNFYHNDANASNNLITWPMTTTTTSTIDTTVSQALDLTATESVNNASNKITSQILTVEVLN